MKTKIHESWYGIGTVKDGATWVEVLLGPHWTEARSKVYRLKLSVVVPVEGYMVVGTTRWVEDDPFGWFPAGRPEQATTVSYDPGALDEDGGVWQGVMTGEYAVELVVGQRKSRFNRI